MKFLWSSNFRAHDSRVFVTWCWGPSLALHSAHPFLICLWLSTHCNGSFRDQLLIQLKTASRPSWHLLSPSMKATVQILLFLSRLLVLKCLFYVTRMFVCHSPVCWEYCVRTWFSSPIMRVPETELGGSLLGSRHLYLVRNTLAAPSVFRRVQTDAHAMAAFLRIFTSYQISTQHHLILLNSYTILYSLNIT